MVEDQDRQASKLVVEATLCHNVYSELSLKVLKAAKKRCTTKIGSMPDRVEIMCRIGRSLIRRMGVKKQDLVKVTKNLMAANGGPLKLDGVVPLNPNLGNSRCSQLVYICPR